MRDVEAPSLAQLNDALKDCVTRRRDCDAAVQRDNFCKEIRGNSEIELRGSRNRTANVSQAAIRRGATVTPAWLLRLDGSSAPDHADWHSRAGSARARPACRG